MEKPMCGGNGGDLSLHARKSIGLEYPTCTVPLLQLTLLYFDPQDKCEIGDVLKDWAMLSMGTKWRNFRSDLKKKYYIDDPSDPKCFTIDDKQIGPTHWRVLVSFQDSEEGKHGKRDDQQNPSFVDVYMVTHTRKKGQPMDNTSAEVMVQLKEHATRQMKNLENSTDRDEILSQILGEDKRNRVCMLGLGLSLTDIYGPKPSRAQALQMLEEMKKSSDVSFKNMSNQVAQMKAEHETLKKNYEDRLVEMEKNMKEDMHAQVNAQVQAALQIFHANTTQNQTRESPSSSLGSSSSSHLPHQRVEKYLLKVCSNPRKLDKRKETVEAQRTIQNKGKQAKAINLGFLSLVDCCLSSCASSYYNS